MERNLRWRELDSICLRWIDEGKKKWGYEGKGLHIYIHCHRLPLTIRIARYSIVAIKELGRFTLMPCVHCVFTWSQWPYTLSNIWKVRDRWSLCVQILKKPLLDAFSGLSEAESPRDGFEAVSGLGIVFRRLPDINSIDLANSSQRMQDPRSATEFASVFFLAWLAGNPVSSQAYRQIARLVRHASLLLLVLWIPTALLLRVSRLVYRVIIVGKALTRQYSLWVVRGREMSIRSKGYLGFSLLWEGENFVVATVIG